MSDVPSCVDDTETLGRAIFDGSKAVDAAKGKVHPKIFREKQGVKELSTDRLDLADIPLLVANHDTQRNGQDLKGWATIICTEARLDGRLVIGNEVPGNPWHADIVLPLTGGPEDQDEQKSQALRLALKAKWLIRD